MEFNINWKPEENGKLHRNVEINEILLDTMEVLFPLESGATILEIGGGDGVFAETAAGGEISCRSLQFQHCGTKRRRASQNESHRCGMVHSQPSTHV